MTNEVGATRSLKSATPSDTAAMSRPESPVVSDPMAARPYMPGYGILGPTEGSGLLSWSWAEERLVASHDYWVATVWPDGRPHSMPVWGIWRDGSLWFSSSLGSRKIRNLLREPRCTVATDNALEPVVVEGAAAIVTDRDLIQRFLEGLNGKYDTAYQIDFFDPGVNATVRVRPRWIFALTEEDFTGSPTTWTFCQPPSPFPDGQRL